MKIILNSLWGKFGQRDNMNQSKIVKTPKELYTLLLNKTIEFTDMNHCPTNIKCIEFRYREKDVTVKQPPTTNVYVASFTTCWARLKLYTLLEKLGEHVLYYDTDSVVYHEGKDEDMGIPLDNKLGGLKDELGGGGKRWITEFVSTGPKSYSYTDNLGFICAKFKGIKKTLANHRVVNPKTMLQCIETPGMKLEVNNLNFKPTRWGYVSSGYQMKIFRMVYNKRWIGDDWVTYPWGY